jgi:hypothetical protein
MPTPLALSDEDIDVPPPTGRADRLGAKTTVPAGRDRRACFVSAARSWRRLSDRARDPTDFTLGAHGETAIVAAPRHLAARRKLHIVPGQIFLLVYSVQGWLEPRGSLAAAVSTAFGGL